MVPSIAGSLQKVLNRTDLVNVSIVIEILPEIFASLYENFFEDKTVVSSQYRSVELE